MNWKLLLLTVKSVSVVLFCQKGNGATYNIILLFMYQRMRSIKHSIHYVSIVQYMLPLEYEIKAD